MKMEWNTAQRNATREEYWAYCAQPIQRVSRLCDFTSNWNTTTALRRRHYDDDEDDDSKYGEKLI